MSEIFNPMWALVDLQQAIDRGEDLRFTELANNFKFRYDDVPGADRFLLAKIVDGEVQSIATFGIMDPIKGVISYSVNYAVSEKHRRRGLAAELFYLGIEVMINRFRHTQLRWFYVEAIIDVANTPSIKLAEKLFSTQGTEIEDEDSGLPVLHFLKLVKIQN